MNAARIRRQGAAAVLAAVAVAPAIAAASTAPPAGETAARAALLRRADVGRGFGASAAPKGRARLTCTAFHPGVRGALQVGSAISPTFAGGSAGPFVSEAVFVFARSSQAAAVARRDFTDRYGSCVEQGLREGSSRRVTLRPRSVKRIAAPVTAARAYAYRVTGTASETGASADVYYDLIALVRGPVIATISITSLNDPADQAFESRVARAAALRLPSH